MGRRPRGGRGGARPLIPIIGHDGHRQPRHGRGAGGGRGTRPGTADPTGSPPGRCPRRGLGDRGRAGGRARARRSDRCDRWRRGGAGGSLRMLWGQRCCRVAGGGAEGARAVRVRRRGAAELRCSAVALVASLTSIGGIGGIGGISGYEPRAGQGSAPGALHSAPGACAWPRAPRCRGSSRGHALTWERVLPAGGAPPAPRRGSQLPPLRGPWHEGI